MVGVWMRGENSCVLDDTNEIQEGRRSGHLYSMRHEQDVGAVQLLWADLSWVDFGGSTMKPGPTAMHAKEAS